ncbi:MAG: prolipoprotein diacylglyceryl transferase [Chloroflexi bacterium]|nr:prolipoprotein diacylglyceryl transferase [Chloroflexota bacterium]
MIKINIDPNLINTISFVLSWHGFFSFVAVGTAVFLVARWARERGISQDAIYSTAIWAIVGGIIGARAVHVVDNWGYYAANPGQILAIWGGGIGLLGAILGGFVGGAIYARISKFSVGAIADLTAPAMLLVQTIGRLGDIINGEHWAKATSLPWGFVYEHPDSPSFLDNLTKNAESAVRALVPSGATVPLAQHPAVVYEMIWNMIALAIIWNLRGRIKPPGMLFVLYLALYGAGRFAVQFVRLDRVWFGGFQEAHVITLAMMLIAVPLLVWKARFVKPGEVQEVAKPEPSRPPRRRRSRFG